MGVVCVREKKNQCLSSPYTHAHTPRHTRVHVHPSTLGRLRTRPRPTRPTHPCPRRRPTSRSAVADAGGSAAGGSVSIAPKLHVLRFNCDRYVAADGTRVGALFHSTDAASANDVLKLKPSRAFAPAIGRVVDELLALCDAEVDDAWFDAQPKLQVSYMRYDGCDRHGVDVDGAVGREHAGRVADDVQPVPLAPAHARNRAAKASREAASCSTDAIASDSEEDADDDLETASDNEEET